MNTLAALHGSFSLSAFGDGSACVPSKCMLGFEVLKPEVGHLKQIILLESFVCYTVRHCLETSLDCARCAKPMDSV